MARFELIGAWHATCSTVP